MSYQLQYRLQQHHVWQRMGGGRTIWFLNCSPCVATAGRSVEMMSLCLIWTLATSPEDCPSLHLSASAWSQGFHRFCSSRCDSQQWTRLAAAWPTCQWSAYPSPTCIWQLKIWELLHDSKCSINATHPSVQNPWRRTQEKALELLFILAQLECVQQFKEAPAPLQWHRIIIKNHGGP